MAKPDPKDKLGNKLELRSLTGAGGTVELKTTSKDDPKTVTLKR